MIKLNAEQLVQQYDLYNQHPSPDDVTFVDVDKDGNFAIYYEHECERCESFSNDLNALKQIKNRIYSDAGEQIKNNDLYHTLDQMINDLEDDE